MLSLADAEETRQNRKRALLYICVFARSRRPRYYKYSRMRTALVSLLFRLIILAARALMLILDITICTRLVINAVGSIYATERRVMIKQC